MSKQWRIGCCWELIYGSKVICVFTELDDAEQITKWTDRGYEISDYEYDVIRKANYGTELRLDEQCAPDPEEIVEALNTKEPTP
jgi:hypothetical protein